jgi:hypothetical protein
MISGTGAAQASTVGAGGGGGGGFMGNLGSLFGGNSIGSSIAGAGTSLFGTGGGGWWTNAGTNLINTPNWAFGLGGIGGGLLGGALFGDKGYGGVGSSLGSTAGSIIGGALIGGPIGAIAGGLLGGVGGGFLGSLFGDDEPVPRVKAGVKDGWLYSTGVEDIEPEQLEQLKQQAAAINELIGALRYSFGEKGQAAVDAYNEPVMGFGPEHLARAGNQVLQAVLDRAAASGDLMAQWISEQVDGKLGETLEESAAAVIGLVNELQYLPMAFEAFEKLGLSLGEGGEQAAIYALEIAKISGGMEALLQKEAFYYENFFSETERLQRTYDDASKVIVAFNDKLGKSGDALIDTREELRKYIEGLDLTTDAGREAYAAALDLAPVLVVLEDALGRLGNSAEDTAYDVVAAIKRLVEAQQQVSDMLSSTAEDVKLRMMTDEEKYNYYKQQIDSLVATLPSLTSIEDIVATVDMINDLSNKAIGLLDTEQLLAGMGDNWIKFLEELAGMATGLLEKVTIEQAEELGTMEDAAAVIAGSGERISAAAGSFENSARVIKAAADAIPRTISVTVNVRERSAEVA